jgi:hypothetical protein
MMRAKPVAGDLLCYAVALHLLMSQDGMDLWQTFADRRWLEPDAAHAAALCGLVSHLARDGDEEGRHASEACTWELIARLGRAQPRPPALWQI